MSYISTKLSTVFGILFLLIVQVGYGQVTKTWDGLGDAQNWSDAANWNPDGVPTSSDDVLLEPEADIFISGNYAAYCKSLTISSDNKIYVNVIIDHGSTLIVENNLTLQPKLRKSTLSGPGWATIYNDGNLIVKGDINLNAPETDRSIIHNNLGLSSPAISANVDVYGNLVVNQYSNYKNEANSTTRMLGANNQSISLDKQISFHNIEINKSNSSNQVTLNGLSSSVDITGTVNIISGVLNDGEKSLTGQVGKSFTVNSEATLATQLGDLPLNFTLDFKPGSTIEFAKSTAQSIPSTTYSNVAFSGTGVKTLAGNITVGNSLNIKSGATLEAGTYNISLAGDWINDGTFTPGTGTLTLNGSAAQQIGGSQALSLNNLTVNKTGTATLIGNMSIGGVLDISNGILNSGANSIAGTGSLTMSGGELQLGTPSVTLPELNLGALSAGKISITGNGSTLKSATYPNLNITGTGTLLGGPVTVSNTMELGSSVNINGHTFTIGTSGANPGTLVQTGNSFFYGGPLTRWYTGSTNGSFPIGANDLYRPLTIGGDATTPSTITVSHTATEGAETTSWMDGTDEIQAVSKSRWQISTGTDLAGSFSMTISGYGLGKVSDVRHLRIVQVGATGVDTSQPPVGTHTEAGGTTDFPEARRSGLSVGTQTLGEGSMATQSSHNELDNTFTVASTDGTNSPLPIRLLSFTATPKDAAVELNWATASERNNVLFEVERSRDGSDYEVIASQKGAINSDQVINYSATDSEPLAGRNVYRLKQTDLDGKFTYSEEVKVYFSNVNASMLLYPNPSSGSNANLLFKGVEGNVYIKLVDAAGRTVTNYTILSNFEEEKVELPTATLKPGIYFLNVVSEAANFKEKIVVY